MIEKNNKFYDYLGLLEKDFSNFKYVVFSWKSGSWKSTYIKKLKKSNDSLKDFIVIDEIYDFYDFIKNLKYFSSSKKKFLIASHIPSFFYYFLVLFWKIKNYSTDKCSEKICKYLDEKWYKYSKNSVNIYISKFKANYTDLDIILENYNWNNFDSALWYFLKYNKLVLDTKKSL